MKFTCPFQANNEALRNATQRNNHQSANKTFDKATFSTKPKTRRHLKGARTTEKRAISFMEHLFLKSPVFHHSCSYETLWFEAMEFFGTNDNRTLERYIGRPKQRKRLPKRTTLVRNPKSGISHVHEVSADVLLPRKVGYLERRSYITIVEGTVYFNHKIVPSDYHLREVKLPPHTPSNESSEGIEVVSSIDDLCVQHIEAKENVDGGDVDDDARETCSRGRERRERVDIQQHTQKVSKDSFTFVNLSDEEKRVLAVLEAKAKPKE